MNYIIHLNAFLDKAAREPWMVSYHYSLYMNLFHMWNRLGFKKTFNIRRDELMAAAKIRGKNTYYRCMRELEAGGYIVFHQAQSRYTMASVSIHELLPGKTQQVSPGRPIHKTNLKLITNVVSNGLPTQEEVINFFSQHQQQKEEALKFWYLHEATNWLVGNTPVQHWQPLAQKWMLNPVNPKMTQHGNSDKDYDEPF
jgi:hypothetical protein